MKVKKEKYLQTRAHVKQDETTWWPQTFQFWRTKARILISLK